MSEPEDKTNDNESNRGDDAKIVVAYKLILFLLLSVLVGLMVARVAMAMILTSPGDHQIECMRDLVRWIELILAALIGLIAGKAAR